ncbi:MAG: type VI secretion system tube protein Hcp, partial [Chloroflexi bacterium]|nr:type VI secretion system tube protein Hcp [Chloroflexota bacterium]
PTAAEPTPTAPTRAAAATPTPTPAPAPVAARQTAVASDSRLATGAAGTAPAPAASGGVCDPCMVMRIASAGAKLEGEVTARGKEGAIEVLSFSYDVKSPRDQASGMATGRRQYQPIIFLKRIDKASPLLAKAYINGTPLTVTLDLYRDNDAGAEERYYKIELENVLISGISVFGFNPEVLTSAGEARRTFVIPHVLEKSGAGLGSIQQEEVSFTFQKITWTNEITKTTATDTWSGQ